MNWHLASDSPPENEHVLLRFEYGGLSPFCVGYFNGEEWYEIRGDDCVAADYPPSHWMPLPDEP